MVSKDKLLFYYFLICAILSYLKSKNVEDGLIFYCIWLPKQNPSVVKLWIQPVEHMIEFFW